LIGNATCPNVKAKLRKFLFDPLFSIVLLKGFIHRFEGRNWYAKTKTEEKRSSGLGHRISSVLIHTIEAS
jgi:hypothetical protein